MSRGVRELAPAGVGVVAGLLGSHLRPATHEPSPARLVALVSARGLGNGVLGCALDCALDSGSAPDWAASSPSGPVAAVSALGATGALTPGFSEARCAAATTRATSRAGSRKRSVVQTRTCSQPSLPSCSTRSRSRSRVLCIAA